MLDDLNIFVHVVKSGSISGASRTLNIHQSQISRAIKKLEEVLKTPLLYRDARKMTVTEYGRLLFDSVSSPIAHIDMSINNFNFLMNDNSGELNLVVPPIFSEYFINRHLHLFFKKYPNLKVNLSFSFRDVGEIDSSFDLAVTTVYPRKNAYIVKKYFESKPILCASKSYIERYGKPETLADLDSHSIMVPKLGGEEYCKWVLFKNNSNDPPVHKEIFNHKMSYDNNLAGKNLVAYGTGITPILDFTIMEELKNGEFVRILPEYHFEAVPFYLVKPNKYKNVRADIFLDFINENRRTFLE